MNGNNSLLAPYRDSVNIPLTNIQTEDDDTGEAEMPNIQTEYGATKESETTYIHTENGTPAGAEG